MAYVVRGVDNVVVGDDFVVVGLNVPDVVTPAVVESVGPGGGVGRTGFRRWLWEQPAALRRWSLPPWPWELPRKKQDEQPPREPMPVPVPISTQLGLPLAPGRAPAIAILDVDWKAREESEFEELVLLDAA